MERRRRNQAALTHTALLRSLMAIKKKARQSGRGAHRKPGMMLAKANMPRRLTVTCAVRVAKLRHLVPD